MDDGEHGERFATAPTDSGDVIPADEAWREASETSGWEDEGMNPIESGYPRNDAYMDPDTSEEELDPALLDNETPRDDVADLIADTQLEVLSARDGIVELTVATASQEDLEATIVEVLGLDGVLEVDAADVHVG